MLPECIATSVLLSGLFETPELICLSSLALSHFTSKHGERIIWHLHWVHAQSTASLVESHYSSSKHQQYVLYHSRG